MIVTKLMGGLGNQMFQYAAGRALSLKYNCELYLDDSYLKADPNGLYTKRHFELHQLNIHAKSVDEKLLRNFKKRRFPASLFGPKGQRLYDMHRLDESFFKTKPPLYLDGFWQSEYYFADHRKTLLLELAPNYDLASEGAKYLADLNACTSVSVHVRRGDYVHLKGASDFHGVLGMEYYQLAMNYIRERETGCKFFVISDDVAWCRKEFTGSPELVFVETGSRYSSCDLFLMSSCRHNILANSSYSWWAAWLNQNPGKIVIAPSKWFADSSQPSDIYAKNWIKI